MHVFDLFKRARKEDLLHPKIYKKMIEDQVPMILLDVRTQNEFDDAYIPNAVLFPIAYVEGHVEKYFPDKKIKYVIYCRSGIRSHSAFIVMKQLGYEDVHDMGGIIDWPYEVITKKNESI